MLDVDGVGGELVRQSQDLIGVVGGVGGVVGPGGGERTGGDPQLVQVDGAGGLYVELVRRGLGEAPGAHQVAVDEVVQLPAGQGNAHGHPLVFVTGIGKICGNRGRRYTVGRGFTIINRCNIVVVGMCTIIAGVLSFDGPARAIP